jgi:hypothetical protein
MRARVAGSRVSLATIDAAALLSPQPSNSVGVYIKLDIFEILISVKRIASVIGLVFVFVLVCRGALYLYVFVFTRFLPAVETLIASKPFQLIDTLWTLVLVVGWIAIAVVYCIRAVITHFKKG